MIYIAIVDDENTFIQIYEKEVSRVFSKFGFECKIRAYTYSRRLSGGSLGS